MRIRIVTASAGTGKTTRLSKLLDETIEQGLARPEGIVATTFTRQAAAELVERARSRLLESGRGREAHQLLAARIGTVNSVSGSFVTDYAFELGESPNLRVLDEAAAELELRRAMAGVVSAEKADELESFKSKFDREVDWRYEARKLIEAARANDLDAAQLVRSSERSKASLDRCLGRVESDGPAIDRALLEAIESALRAIDLDRDTTKGTTEYVELLRESRPSLEKNRLRWGDWAKLSGASPCKASKVHAEPVQRAAARHIAHPRLREDMHRFITLLFEVAAAGLTGYQNHKRERGVIDFVDQETLALRLLRRDDVRADLEGQIDLVLVDEFQDTSPIELAIFLELAKLARDSVWVGDPKQAIYSFRGTDPKLMDAAIESLTSTTNDPELVRDAVAKVADTRPVETLSVSYRSRPELVAITNDIFAPAFRAQGMPEERTRTTPFLTDEPTGLGPILEHWPLSAKNEDARAAAVAAGVSNLLGRAPRVRDRKSGEVRKAEIRDVAVLCRTNKQCQAVAEALADLDIPAVVPRMRLLETAEGQLAVAGLQLWVDPRDPLAAAIIARISTYPTDLDAFVDRALTAPGFDAFASDSGVQAIREAREANKDLDPVEAVDAVFDALNLRRLSAAWGNGRQRLANLDALRAHAASYVANATSGRDAPTVIGFLRRLDEMIDEWGWYQARTDSQALLGGAEAVTISTWHRAKGLEWPITVLFGLESLRDPLAYGVHVMSDREDFDVANPLSDRWIRFWPNPYTTSNQKGAVKEAYERSAELEAVKDRIDREALRVLYVGWTRARDTLILAAERGKLLGGLLGKLRAIDEGLITEPVADRPAEVEVTWAGRRVTITVYPAAPAEPVARSPRAGEYTLGRARTPYPAARMVPSRAEPIPCTLTEPIVLGAHLNLVGRPDMEIVGRAVHGFLAADRRDRPLARRVDLAGGILQRYEIQGSLAPEDVVRSADQLWRWIEATFPGARACCEWPLAHRLPNGTILSGAPDLVLEHAGALAVIDHKTFPGRLAEATERARQHSGQLAAYASALGAATSADVSTWIHFPILSAVVRIEPSAPRFEPLSSDP